MTMVEAVVGKLKAYLGVAALFLTWAVAASPAQGAAPRWLPTAAVSGAATEVSAPAIAVDSAGDATALWRRPGEIEAAMTTARGLGLPQGTWEPPTTLYTSSIVGPPTVAVDNAGDATAAWSSEVDVIAETKFVGKSWRGHYSPYAVGEGLNSREPQVVVTPAGEAAAIWREESGGSSGGPPVVAADRRLSANEIWDFEKQLSPGVRGQAVNHPHIAIDPAGDQVGVWVRWTEGVGPTVMASNKPRGGNWGAPVDISGEAAGDLVEQPEVAIDKAGDAIAVFRLTGPAGAEPRVVMAASRPAGGEWETPIQISQTGVPSGRPQIAFDSEGMATAVWQSRVSGAISIVQAATKPAAGGWGAPVPVSGATPGNYAEDPQLAIGGDDAFVAWEAHSGPKVIDVARRPAGAGWETPVALSSATEGVDSEPVIAVDGQGDGFVAWTHRDAGGSTTIETTRSTQVDEPPVILSGPIVSPGVFGGVGGTAKIEVEGIDDFGVAGVEAIVSRPGGGHTEVPLTPVGGSRYEGSFEAPPNPGAVTKAFPVEVVLKDTSRHKTSASAASITVAPAGTPNPGYLAFEPGHLDFGGLKLGFDAIRTAVVRNTGKPGSPPVTGSLTTTDPAYTLKGETGKKGLTLTLAPGETRAVQIYFQPESAGRHDARLILSRTNSESEPNGGVALTGKGHS
jgi:hypothetical protein